MGPAYYIDKRKKKDCENTFESFQQLFIAKWGVEEQGTQKALYLVLVKERRNSKRQGPVL